MANDTNTNGRNGTTKTLILAVTGMVIALSVMVVAIAAFSKTEVAGLVAQVIGFAVLIFGLLFTYITAKETTRESKEARLEAAAAKAQSEKTDKSVNGLLHEYVAAKTGEATAVATLARIDVEEAKAEVLAKATDVVTTSTTTTTLSSPATIDADVVAGVDAVVSGPEG